MGEMMMRLPVSAVARSCLIGVCLAGLSPPAQAQQSAKDDGLTLLALPRSTDGPVILTGSSLPAVSTASAAPLAVIDGSEFRLSGTLNPEVLLNDLPQFHPGETAFFNNGSDGNATLDLRGLGPTETLVLVNGHRWIPSGVNEVVDINTIPAFLIDKVEVATGGSSAVYGSGGAAGTVNFRLRSINAFEAGAQAAITSEGDARRVEAHLAYGGDFAEGRGHASTYVEYLDRSPLLASARDFTDHLLVDGFTGGLHATGSSASPYGRLTALYGGYGTNFDRPAIFASPGVSRPFKQATAQDLGDLYNFASQSGIVAPQERWTVGGDIRYDLSPHARIYGEFAIIRNKTSQRLAPEPLTTFARIDINAVARYLSPQDRAQFAQISDQQFDPGFASFDLRYRSAQVGPRMMREDHKAWHALAGVTGQIGALTYDAFYSYDRTTTPTQQTGEVNLHRFTALVQDGTCNVFGRGLLSQNCIAAISVPLAHHEQVTQQIAQATLSGPLFHAATAQDPVRFSAGIMWRAMDGQIDEDPKIGLTQSGALVPVRGRYHVADAFAEITAPLLQDNLLHLLALDFGARVSRRSVGGVRSPASWFIGGELAPTSDITIKGQFQRTVRTPSLTDMFTAGAINYEIASDPCSFFAPDMSDGVRKTCIATGVPPENVFNFFPPFQNAVRIGGNPALRDERATNWNAGLVLQPRAVPRFTLTADYYHLDLTGIVGSINSEALVDACYLAIQNAQDPICRLITRTPSTGEIAQIDGRNRGIGERTTSGVDFAVNYTLPLAAHLFGSGHSAVTLQVLGNWLSTWKLKPLGDVVPAVSCAGRFGLNCGDPRPRWSWVSRISWNDGPMTTSLRWRHTGAVRDDDDTTNYTVDRIGGYDLFDLGFVLHASRRYDLRFGINNLLGTRPPILGSNAGPEDNTYPSTYDILGRDLFFAVDLAI